MPFKMKDISISNENRVRKFKFAWQLPNIDVACIIVQGKRGVCEATIGQTKLFVFAVTRPTLFFTPSPKFYWKIKILQIMCLQEPNLLLFN